MELPKQGILLDSKNSIQECARYSLSNSFATDVKADMADVSTSRRFVVKSVHFKVRLHKLMQR